jgi:hypothetical protein
MIEFKFGDIYWIPLGQHKNQNISNHWVTILCALKERNEIVYQTFGSGFWRVFPILKRLLTANSCHACGDNFFSEEEFEDFKENPRADLDVDCVHFINHRKYQPSIKLMRRETFISFGDGDGIVKDNLFDFQERVNGGIYTKEPISLFRYNQIGVILAVKNSPKIDPFYADAITKFYQNSQS